MFKKPKLSIDEDLLFFSTSRSLWSYIYFWKSWIYRVELPLNRIKDAEVKKYGFTHELRLQKDEKNITVNLAYTSKEQRLILTNVLPKVIKEKLNYTEIQQLKKSLEVA